MLRRLTDRRPRGCRRTDSTRPGRARERGAVLVEAAIIAPMLFALVFGTMEMGYAYYGKLTVEHMSLAGARAASGSAKDYLADYNTLAAVKDAKTGVSTSSITKIVIYRASSPSDRVPTACKSAAVTNSYTSSIRGCNYYTGSDLSRPSTDFGCAAGPPGPVNKPDRFWCPTDRKAALLATNGNGPPDYVGVYVEGVHQNLIGLFGKSFTFTNDTVIRIEPRTKV